MTGVSGVSSRRPWLGGVCAELARRLGWSTGGVRAAMVIALLVWPLLTVAGYVLAAWWLHREAEAPRPARSGTGQPEEPAMDEWERRLADFDRRLGA